MFIKRLNTKPVDGIYGPISGEDVEMWQSLHDENGKVVSKGKGLFVDGIVREMRIAGIFTG